MLFNRFEKQKLISARYTPFINTSLLLNLKTHNSLTKLKYLIENNWFEQIKTRTIDKCGFIALFPELKDIDTQSIVIVGLKAGYYGN